MKAKLAYLTSPAPNRFTLHVQPENCCETLSFEISRAHLTNIIIDGASWSLRELNRVPEIPQVQEAG